MFVNQPGLRTHRTNNRMHVHDGGSVCDMTGGQGKLAPSLTFTSEWRGEIFYISMKILCFEKLHVSAPCRVVRFARLRKQYRKTEPASTFTK